jgi:hypothetical protein
VIARRETKNDRNVKRVTKFISWSGYIRKSKNVIIKNATNMRVVVHTEASMESCSGPVLSGIPVTVRLICRKGIATLSTTRKNARIRIKFDEPSLILFPPKNITATRNTRTHMIPITTELPIVAKSTILY